MRLSLPDRSFARALVFRSVVVWGALRAVAVAGRQSGPSAAGRPASALELHPAALVFLATTVVAAILLDARLRKEEQFLANLGCSRYGIAAIVVITVLVLESAVFLVGGAR